jgi:hypothetical protein
MKFPRKISWFLVVLVPSIAVAGGSLTIDGTATTQPSHFMIDQLKQTPGLPTTQISYESHGLPHRSTCVGLLDLLHAAGISTEIKMDPKADPRTKHRELRMLVTARASDGYAVVFSLAELLPDIGHRAVWLALDEDGTALPDRDAPLKLIVPDDAKPARWVHGVGEITVDDAPPAH